MVELSFGITVDPAVRFGKPVIRGTRVPVDTVVACVACGRKSCRFSPKDCHPVFRPQIT